MYVKRVSAAQAFQVVSEFRQIARRGQILDHEAFKSLARQVVTLVGGTDGRLKLSRLDLAQAVVDLQWATAETWESNLSSLADQARKVEKQLAKVISKEDPFFYEATILDGP